MFQIRAPFKSPSVAVDKLPWPATAPSFFMEKMAEGGGFEPPVALACHIGLANRRTKPGYATPPKLGMKTKERGGENANQKPIFSNSVKVNMMHEVPLNIKQLQLSIVSIGLVGTAAS